MPRRFPWLTSVVLVTVALTAHPSRAQSSGTFRSGVDVVALDVCVKDREGRFVPDLAAADFLVLDENELARSPTFRQVVVFLWPPF